MRRALAILCAAALLCLCGSVFAADAGSAQDPLLSRSYVLQWQELLLSDRAARAQEAGAALVTEGARSVAMLRGRCGEQGVRREALRPGDRILLREGDTITLLSGAGAFTEGDGPFIDVTAGSVLSGAALPERHRLVAGRDVMALFTAGQNCVVVLTGTAVVSHFSDVAPGDWFGVSTDYASARSLMQGTGEGRFSPGTPLTRAMFVTILGRMAGARQEDYAGSSFSDVAVGSWYAPYVQWGAKNGIVNGVGEGRFAPDSPVTREQMAALITRYADAAGYTLPQGVGAVRAFRDLAQVSSWAFESVERMRQTGLLSGDTEGNFHPRSGATRAEAATVFMRLDATIRLL